MKTDAELIDALERFINENERITLWIGDGDFDVKRGVGLSLFGGKRTLREALENIA